MCCIWDDFKFGLGSRHEQRHWMYLGTVLGLQCNVTSHCTFCILEQHRFIMSQFLGANHAKGGLRSGPPGAAVKKARVGTIRFTLTCMVHGGLSGRIQLTHSGVSLLSPRCVSASCACQFCVMWPYSWLVLSQPAKEPAGKTEVSLLQCNQGCDIPLCVL